MDSEELQWFRELGRESEVDSEVAGRERVYLEKWAKRKMAARQRVRSELPPPLPWLSTKGHPSFVLHPDRRDGRIIMTAVRLDQHDVFLAARHGGRLTLQLAGRPPRPFTTTTTTNDNDNDDSDDPKEETKEHDEQDQEDEDRESPEKPLHVMDLDVPVEGNNANRGSPQEKQEVQAERDQSLAKCLNAAITIASKIEVQEYENHDGGSLVNEYYNKESQKEDKSDSGAAHLFPAMPAGSSQGLWRCCSWRTRWFLEPSVCYNDVRSGRWTTDGVITLGVVSCKPRYILSVIILGFWQWWPVGSTERENGEPKENSGSRSVESPASARVRNKIKQLWVRLADE